jgi:hypothetical protein
MKKKTSNLTHLGSREVQKKLKIRACDIMHLREAGKLRFEKKGNAYMYFEEDVNSLLDNE